MEVGGGKLKVYVVTEKYMCEDTTFIEAKTAEEALKEYENREPNSEFDTRVLYHCKPVAKVRRIG